MRIKHNPASASTLRHLAEAQQELSLSLNRMASGQRTIAQRMILQDWPFQKNSELKLLRSNKPSTILRFP